MIIAQIICCIWHCWDYVAFGTGTVGIMLHLALLALLARLALCKLAPTRMAAGLQLRRENLYLDKINLCKIIDKYHIDVGLRIRLF